MVMGELPVEAEVLVIGGDQADTPPPSVRLI